MKCPNENCKNENVAIEDGMVSCEECQGLWSKSYGGLRVITPPRDNAEFVMPEMEDIFGYDNLGHPSTMEHRKDEKKASKWR